jgi:hypothetical protein
MTTPPPAPSAEALAFAERVRDLLLDRGHGVFVGEGRTQQIAAMVDEFSSFRLLQAQARASHEGGRLSRDKEVAALQEDVDKWSNYSADKDACLDRAERAEARLASLEDACGAACRLLAAVLVGPTAERPVLDAAGVLGRAMVEETNDERGGARPEAFGRTRSPGG